jgi:Ca-activated chloride channel homolog
MKLINSLTKSFFLVLGLLAAPNNGLAQPAVVTLPVTTVDKKTNDGVTVSKDQIKLFLDNKEQSITEIVSAETPAKIVFMVDYSGSMRHLFSDPTKIKIAFMQFFQASSSANEYALIAFNADAALIKEWTKKPEEIIAGLDLLTAQKPQGKTALFDSLVKSMHYLSTKDSGKKALVLITDGVDKNSMLKRQEIAQKIGDYQIPLYCVFLDESGGESSGLFGASSVTTAKNTMIEMGKNTGGDVIVVTKPNDFEKAFTKIGNIVRHQFLIKFTPSTGDEDKRINIKVKFFSSTNPLKEIDNLKILYPQYYVAKK